MQDQLNIETDAFKLAWGNGAGLGTYIIIRKADDATTYRNTGSDAIDDFRALLNAFTQSDDAFNALCSAEDFHAEQAAA